MMLILGGIYKTEWSQNPVKVIGFDDCEVFFDSFREHNQSWAFSGNLKKQSFFYRTSASVFIETAVLLKTVAISTQELSVFRPDLPMRLFRNKNADWNSNEFIEDKNGIFNNSTIFVHPLGKKGALQKGQQLFSENGQFFTYEELYRKVSEVQMNANSELKNGTGLFRLGFQKGAPSYYTGSYFDLAGILKN